MKIRTSFVTNSSGSSSSRVKIENETLVSILKKYNDEYKKNNKKSLYDLMDVEIEEGTSVLNDTGSWGDEGNWDIFWEPVYPIETIPQKLMSNLRKNASDKYVNDLFDELEHELNINQKKIYDSYKKIEYTTDYSGDLGIIGSTNSETIITNTERCPKCGSYLVYDKHSADGYGLREDYEESGIEYNVTISCLNRDCDYSIDVIDYKKYDSVKEKNNDDLPF